MSATKLTIEQQKFITLRLSGLSTSECAKKIGITERTAFRWMNYPAVSSALAKVQEEVAQTAHEIIVQRYTEALEASCEAVTSIVTDQAVQPQVRLKAAQMIQDRLAPIAKLSDEAQPVEPLYGLYITNHEYATNEELTIIQDIQTAINARKEEAEQGKIVQIRRTG